MNYDQKLKTAKTKILLFMMENDTTEFSNEEFIVQFRKITQNLDIASETITRARRYWKNKRNFLNKKDSSEMEESYKNEFSEEYGLDYKKV